MLEKQSRVQVAIGGGVLLEEVEAALSELNAGPAAFGARARYHGAEVGLRLDVDVETVLPPKEERVDFAGDGSVGAARRELLDELIAAARPSSIVDVGCGEATLLCRVLDRALADAPGATPPQLVGVEALGPPLRKAQAAIERRLQAHANGANARVALYRGALEGLVGGEALELPYGIDLVTCVEVVEHLDPAPLAAFGDAILGRCAPRVAIVTTPNKEYNVLPHRGLVEGAVQPAGEAAAARGARAAQLGPPLRVDARRVQGVGRRVGRALRLHRPLPRRGRRRLARGPAVRRERDEPGAPRERRRPGDAGRHLRGDNRRRPRPTPRRWRRGSGRRRSGCGPRSEGRDICVCMFSPSFKEQRLRGSN